MKAVPPDSFVHAVSTGERVFTGHAGQGGKERGVEGRNLRDLRSRNSACGLDPFEGFRVVQRGKFGQGLDGFQYARIDPDGPRETPATMNYAVRHRVRCRREFFEKSAEHLLWH